MGSKKIVGVVEDLFFGVKITDAAKRAGLPIVYAKTEEAVLAQSADASLVIIDLNHASLPPIPIIQKLKASTSARLLGYVSHVQTEVKQRALEAGCDTVLAKSAFSSSVGEIIKQHAEAAA